jgi:hypothetical protein
MRDRFLRCGRFGEGWTLKRVDANLYDWPDGTRMIFVDKGPTPILPDLGGRLQRVPWWLDMRWIAPALAVSLVIAVGSLIASRIGALWRRRRKRRWTEDGGDRRCHLAARLVLFVGHPVDTGAT